MRALECFRALVSIKLTYSVRRASTKVILRQYQEDAIQAILDKIASGKRRLGLSLATGSGKTVIFTHLMERIKGLEPQRKQILVLAHRRELVEQAADHSRRTHPDKVVEVEMGNSHASGTADITIASVQSLARPERLQKFDPNFMKLIIIDEAHHSVSQTYLGVLKYFNTDIPETSTIVVGVSATLSRLDGLALDAVMDDIVFHRGVIDMVRDGFLAPAKFTSVQNHFVKLDSIAMSNGDFRQDQLASRVNTVQAREATVNTWLELASKRKSTIVFAVDINHCEEMTMCFRQYGIDARFVTSHTPKAERHHIISEFKLSKFPVLINVGIFTEGTDIPNIDCVLLTRPTTSQNLVLQMIGRGLRLAENKEDCHIIDMTASNFKHGIVSLPTLFGLDPSMTFREQSLEQLEGLDKPEAPVSKADEAEELLHEMEKKRHVEAE